MLDACGCARIVAQVRDENDEQLSSESQEHCEQCKKQGHTAVHQLIGAAGVLGDRMREGRSFDRDRGRGVAWSQLN